MILPHCRCPPSPLRADNLGENSPLELCYYLGKLRENRMALHPASIGRRDKDTMIRVPALRWAYDGSSGRGGGEKCVCRSHVSS